MFKVHLLQLNIDLADRFETVDKAIEAGLEAKREFTVENQSYRIVATWNDLTGLIKFSEIDRKGIDSNKSNK